MPKIIVWWHSNGNKPQVRKIPLDVAKREFPNEQDYVQHLIRKGYDSMSWRADFETFQFSEDTWNGRLKNQGEIAVVLQWDE